MTPPPSTEGLIGANGQPVKLLQIGGRTVEVDAEIAPLVQALNDAGFETIASCSGHGFRPGNIALRDGRELVITRDFAEARKIDALFPLDINGNTRTPPTLNSFKAKVERAATRGNVGPDLGAMSYAERDKVLFGIRSPEGPPDDVLVAVRALLDKHIEQCRVAINECETWAASTPSEWERARDALLNFSDDLEALAHTPKAVAPDDVLVEMRKWFQAIRDEAWQARGTEAGIRICELTTGALEALARFTQPKGGAD